MKIVPDESRAYHLDRAMSLADESANKHLCSMQLCVNIVHFLKLMRVVLKQVPLERWILLMIGGFKPVSLVWVNKVAMIGYTWLFVYDSLRRYEGRINAAPGVVHQRMEGLHNRVRGLTSFVEDAFITA